MTWLKPLFPITILSLALISCNELPVANHAKQLSTQQLLQNSPLLETSLKSSSFDTKDEADLLALTPQMRDFIKQHVSNTSNKYLSLNQLLKAMLDERLLGIDYVEITRTAQETFITGNGNCLSFTNLFVAFARELDLKVRYQEVDIPPNWDNSANMLILSGHINAEVILNNADRRAVDFNISNFKTSYPRRIITDQRAKAHYYSNIAVENMLKKNYQNALVSIIKGVDADPTFSPLWNNLGSLYSRNNLLDHAHASYMQALTIDRDNYVALSNLAKINRRLNQPDIAAQYEKKVKYHRNRNPYYHYFLAKNAFQEKNYKQSINHLENAIKRKPDEDSFYFLMSINHIKMGDKLLGKQFLQTAKKFADEPQSGLYQSKIDRLFSHIH